MLGKSLIKAAAGNVGGEVIEDLFQTWLYTGNGSTQTITNGIDLAGEGGLVWIKRRDSTSAHAFYDTERGIGRSLSSDDTQAQSPVSPVGKDLTAFNANGFSLGGNNYEDLNFTGNYASWTFRKAPGFFDVVTWTVTGAASSNRRINHLLGSEPGTIIIKRTDAAGNWFVYHRSLGVNSYLVLNTGSGQGAGNNWWGTASTSTDFGVNEINLGITTGTYVAYLFAHDEQIFGEGGDQSVIKCGSFTADGIGNAAVTLGWEPQWLLVKRSDNSGDWFLFDTMRGWARSTYSIFYAHLSNAEIVGGGEIGVPTATGFQFGPSGGLLAPSGTYIYIAIRRGPMKTPTSGTEVFSVTAGTDTAPYSVGFPTDLATIGYRNGNANYAQSVGTRLTGNSANLFTTNTNAEDTTKGQTWSFDLQNNFDQNWVSSPAARWNFRRAPGFFDVVAYTGNGGSQTISHNLAAIPEIILVKKRNGTSGWTIELRTPGVTARGELNSDAAISNSNLLTSVTSSSFTSSAGYSVYNASGDTYIAYLFATLPGISKVGSYTGTGTTLNVDCGFASGSRLVLIKRTDSTGDWYIWDAARGIISGNDPFLLLNSTAAENASTDYIDPLSSGFQISSTAPAAINANGGSYIFLAIS